MPGRGSFASVWTGGLISSVAYGRDARRGSLLMESTCWFSPHRRWLGRARDGKIALASSAGRRPSLERIDTAVSERLGPTRLPGNAQPACFNRQIAMYLARNVGRWSATAIARFYNGRDHSTMSYGIQRIEALRETDPEVDALLNGS